LLFLRKQKLLDRNGNSILNIYVSFEMGMFFKSRRRLCYGGSVRDISSESSCTDLREGISSLSVELSLSHGRTVISRGESVSDPTTATKDIHTPYHLRIPGAPG